MWPRRDCLLQSALTGQGIYPRPLQKQLPIWVGVGGSPQSFARAGTLGLPLMVAIIGGETRGFAPLVKLYREAGRRAGHAPEHLRVGLHSLGYLAETSQRASDEFFPGYARSFYKALLPLFSVTEVNTCKLVANETNPRRKAVAPR